MSLSCETLAEEHLLSNWFADPFTESPPLTRSTHKVQFTTNADLNWKFIPGASVDLAPVLKAVMSKPGRKS